MIRCVYMLVLCLFALSALAQNDEVLNKNLEIRIGKSRADNRLTVVYPGETRFEVFDADYNRVAESNDEVQDLALSGKYEVYVYPSWTDRAQRFKVEQEALYIAYNNPTKEKEKVEKKEKIEVAKQEDTGYSRTVIYNSAYSPANMPATEIVKREPGAAAFTLELELDNGLRFTFADGVARASLNGKELEVIDNYLVNSPLGTLQVNFDPATNSCNWTFDVQ